MPPSQRITIRLSPVLAARLAATVGPQGNVADIVRHAIEAYLDDDSASWQPRQPLRQPQWQSWQTPWQPSMRVSPPASSG